LADSQNIIARPTTKKDFAVPLAHPANAANSAHESVSSGFRQGKVLTVP
jgi:hypothetical protein